MRLKEQRGIKSSVTDRRCRTDQATYRILAIHTDYDRRNARYDQTLTLGAP